MAGGAPSLRQRIYAIVEGTDSRALAPRLFATGIVLLIIVNVVAAVCETVPSILTQHRHVFVAIEYVSLLVFAIEYLVRLWVAVENPRFAMIGPVRGRIEYALTPAAIVDFIAIVPFFVQHFVPGVDLRVLVLLRLLRLFKLARYSTGFQSLFEAIRRERQALLASFLVLFSVVLISATLAYLAERDLQPVEFGTIPSAVWWSIETVTTVGYGDVVPKTVAGRIVGGLTMITGILMIALPIAVIGSSFAEIVRQRSFVVSLALVSRLPLFAKLDPQILSELLPLIRSVSVEAGTAVVEPGIGEDDFFVIADGIVEVERPGGPQRLSIGGSFGAIPLTGSHIRSAPALALTRVRLLSMDRIELAHVAERHSELAARLGLGDVATPGA
jgi:voltage-gated potassium channel